MGLRVLKAGFVPFIPWLDAQLFVLGASHGVSIDLDEIRRYSMQWLEVCDAVVVEPVGAAESRGTQAELARARERGIPVFWSVEELISAAAVARQAECEHDWIYQGWRYPARKHYECAKCGRRTNT